LGGGPGNPDKVFWDGARFIHPSAPASPPGLFPLQGRLLQCASVLESVRLATAFPPPDARSVIRARPPVRKRWLRSASPPLSKSSRTCHATQPELDQPVGRTAARRGSLGKLPARYVIAIDHVLSVPNFGPILRSSVAYL